MSSRPFISLLEIAIFGASIAVGLGVLLVAFAVHARKNRKTAGFEVTLTSAQTRHPEQSQRIPGSQENGLKP